MMRVMAVYGGDAVGGAGVSPENGKRLLTLGEERRGESLEKARVK